MKKFTLFLFVLLIAGQINAQVEYEYGWEPSGLGNWTNSGTGTFLRDDSDACSGAASARANVYYDGTNTFQSPSLGTSNGGVVTFNFDYKVTQYDDNATGAQADLLEIQIQWANSSAGDWNTLDVINSENHEVATTCANKTYTFSPLPGELYVRFLTKAIGSQTHLYFYYDKISVTQGAAPACLPPFSIQFSNIASGSATISWSESTSLPSDGYEYYYSDSNTQPSGSGSPIADLSTNIASLNDNTLYYVWVRSICESGPSQWYGPVSFQTPCVTFNIPFSEDFDSDSATESCWTVLNGNADNDSWNLNYIYQPIEGDQSVNLLTDGNMGTNDDWLISPRITLTGTQQLSFKYKVHSATEPNDFRVVLSTTGKAPADFTTILMSPTAFSNTVAMEKIISLTDYTGDVFIAWHVPPGGLDGWRLYIDDIAIDESPADPPACILDMNAVTGQDCGNFPTTFEWSAVEGADGYKVSIGTAPGAQDLMVDNLDIGNVLAYSFSGNPNTTYYYTIRPYNGYGSATDCYEDMFTTYGDGCYCTNNITGPINGNGISNVLIVADSFSIPAISNAEFLDGAVDITRGVNTLLNITLETGYSYGTNVWIDFNDNYTFEPSELVFFGQSPTNNPVVLDATFMTPMGANLGEHRMRVLSTYATPNPANPCYSGPYAIALDFIVNVIDAPSCLPPSAASTSQITASSAKLDWIATATSFNIEYDYAGFSQGWGINVSGINENTANLNNLDPQTDYEYYIQSDCGEGSTSSWAGPFTFRTACSSFEDFFEDFQTEVSFAAPECWSTLSITTDQYAGTVVYDDNDYVQMYNNGDAAAQLYLITPSLASLPAAAHEIKFTASTFSSGVSVIVGTMGDPTLASSFTAVQTVPISNATTEYNVPFTTATTDQYVAFKFVGTGSYQSIFIDDVMWEAAPLSTDEFEINKITAYPNPVKEILTVGFIEDISDIEVVNMLGQLVMTQNVNAPAVRLDMSDLASGTYLLKINSGNQVRTIKIVKQ